MLLKTKKGRKGIIKKNEVEKQYYSYPSLSDQLPWLEWSDKHNVMLLEDGFSVGAILELRDISTEAKPQEFIQGMHESITKMFSTVVPLEDENPWILQFFIQDDLTLDALYQRLRNYIARFNSLQDPFAQKFLKIMHDHFKKMCCDDGMFIDPMSGLVFRGKTRRIRVAIYRRYSEIRKNSLKAEVLDELEATISKFISQLQQIGLKVRRMRGEHLYDWLVRWFNPKPQKTHGDIDQLLELFPYPKDSQKPFGWSFTQNVFFGGAESYQDGWIFDSLKHKVLVFKDLQEAVDIGVISRERNFGESSKYSLLDKFPPGTIYTIQVVFESKNKIKRHLFELEKAAVGRGVIIKEILQNIERAYREIDNGNMLFRCVEAIYFCGKTDEELKNTELTITSLLNNSGLDVIETSRELYPADTYLRFLPFNFNYYFDKKYTFRSTYKYADDVVRLLPIYGRSRGDGLHPLQIYFNRGGEGFIFDHLHPEFKRANSHMAIIGSTGAGKSVLLNYLCMCAMATRNPRIILIEAGGSFDILTRFFAAYDKNVHSMKFQRIKPIAVNPFAESDKALVMVEQEEKLLAQNINKKIDKLGLDEEIAVQHSEKQSKEILSQNKTATLEEQECAEDRDILSEMALATRTMITGGDNKEEENITRADMMLINRVLIYAMKKSRERGYKQMLVQHVIAAFNEVADQEPSQELKARLKKFALSMEEYQTGLKARFINRESEPLGDYDFLQVELGFLQEKKYQDFLNVVCISLLAKILALAEAGKESGRPTILIMDEAHILFKSEMVASFVTLMAKVARKIGLWLIPCTQNLNDFSGIESRKVLSMMETWLCLAIEKDEVDLINQFKPLTPEARELILDIRKYPKIYSEGVLLGKNYQGLFRNVPPRLALSLAMTEQDERSERKKIQDEQGLSEMEAVELMAQQLENFKQRIMEDREFDN